MGSNPNSAQPVSAVGNIALVFSPVQVKVTHPPPTGVFLTFPASHCFPPWLVRLRAWDRNKCWI